MADTIVTLRQTTAEQVRQFVGCGPRHIGSRLGLLALTALGVVATAASGSMAAVLGGVGLNIGASALYEHLQELKRKRAGGPTLDDALAAVERMGAAGQAELQQIAERVDVVPVFFDEALRRQRSDLLAGMGQLLTTWGGSLPFDRLEASLDQIAAEQAGGVNALQADHAAIQAQLVALRDGLRGDVAGQVGPLTAEVAALRGQIDALLRRLETQEAARPPRPPRPKTLHVPRTGDMMKAIQDEIDAEFKSLLS